MEGWNSWRVPNMGLLNIGRQEGSQIIQLLGRGVRLKGADGRTDFRIDTLRVHGGAMSWLAGEAAGAAAAHRPDEERENHQRGQHRQAKLLAQENREEGGDEDAEREGDQAQDDVDQVLRRQPEGLLHDALQLQEGDHRTAEGHRSDQRTQHGQGCHHRAVHLAAGELDGRDQRRGAAAGAGASALPGPVPGTPGS